MTMAPSGGMCMLHDYFSSSWLGNKEAINEFCARTGEQPILMPDKSGSAFIPVAHPRAESISSGRYPAAAKKFVLWRGRPRAVFARAAHTVLLDLVNQRIAAVSVEPHVLMARYDASLEEPQEAQQGQDPHMALLPPRQHRLPHRT
ncbi:MAG: hypothetical protein GDA49_00695 [Rhodospirillales bacterium]|nr:hypothetical protein [Rhodospirillales bacterium]